jgi:hypothetical protein
VLLNGEKIASLNITHRQMPGWKRSGEQQELSLCGEDSVNFAFAAIAFLSRSKILRHPLIFFHLIAF